MTPEFTRASDTRADSIISALTVEGAAYIALALAAFMLRFSALGVAPLSSTEALQALAAFNVSQGMVSTFTGSPLLLTANTLIFALFTANDFTARLAPAIAGTALVLLPILFRRDLGRAGALVASGLLAFSPPLVLFSRTLDGVIPAVATSLAALAFGKRYFETRAASGLYLAVSFAALALLSAPDVWTICLACLLFLGVSGLRADSWIRASLRETVDNSNVPPTLVESRKFKALILFAIIFFFTSTTFIIHKEGIGAGFDLLATWLASLIPGATIFDMLRLLLIYDPLVVFFGAGFSIDYMFFQREKTWDGSQSLLAIWTGTAFILLSLSSNNNPSRVVIIVVPLALLAGAGIGAWIEGAVGEARALGAGELTWHELPILAGGVGLIAFLSIVVAGTLQQSNIALADVFARTFGLSQDNPGLANALVLLLFLFSLVTAAVLAITTLGQTRALRVGTLLALVVLSIWTFRQTMMLNFPDVGALNPLEWLVVRSTSPNVRDLVSDLESESRWRANDTHALVIAADASLGPLVQWYLRDFHQAVFSTRPAPTPDTQAIIAMSDAPAPASGWIEQRYQVEMTRARDSGSSLRALIYRDSGSTQSTSVSLWIQRP